MVMASVRYGSSDHWSTDALKQGERFMTRISALTLVLGAVVFAGCTSTHGRATPEQTAKVQLQIEQANADLESAYQDGDADRVVMLFTEDAVFLSNRLVDLRGREAIGRFLGKFFRIQTVTEFTLTIAELDVYGPTAYERGTFVWTSVGRDQDTTVQRKRYSIVRTLDADGQWLIHRLLDGLSPAPTHAFMQP